MTFEQFIETRLRTLLRTATAICGDPSLAEDLVQDVLIKTHKRWAHIIRDIDNPDAYVRRMLVNEYVSWRRKWSRMVPRSHVEVVDTVPDHASGHAEADALRVQIAELPRQQQVVLALRYYADLPDAQIAAAMGCTESSVRGYASRALARLRREAHAALNQTEGCAT